MNALRAMAGDLAPEKVAVSAGQISVSFGKTPILHGIDLALRAGRWTSIVGPNGAGKSTLLKILDGTITPTAGHVNIGKTVKFAVLSQRLDELEKLGKYKIKEVLSRYKPSYIVDGKETTPGQMMERLGFESAQLMTPIKDLSGGQKRRMQLLLILLDEPNVLIMDEPGNDLDTDMLAVMEDLLDTWPGTMLVVSHDRYLMERVTDDQFALIDGSVRHVPGGVDEYLSLLDERSERLAADQAESVATVPTTSAESTGMSNTERRELKKRFDAVGRKLEKMQGAPDEIRTRMAQTSATDYEALMALQGELDDTIAQLADLEDEWLELSETLEQ